MLSNSGSNLSSNSESSFELTCNSMNMSSSFGLDYFDIINNTIKSILYPKPQTTKKHYEKIIKNLNTEIFFIQNNVYKMNICVCEISPQIKLSDKILIFTHGNGSDIYTFYPYLVELSDNLGINVVCWDYPEYGLSTGVLDEHNCYEAFENVVSHYLKKKIKFY